MSSARTRSVVTADLAVDVEDIDRFWPVAGVLIACIATKIVAIRNLTCLKVVLVICIEECD